MQFFQKSYIFTEKCQPLKSGSQKVNYFMQLCEAAVTNEYFNKLGDCLTAIVISELLTASTLSTLTNRMFYVDIASFPSPKIVRDSALDYSNVWRRLHSPVLHAEARDVLFLLVHNKLPVPERLFRIRLRQDPYCQYCPGAEISDLEHFFCSCEKTRQGWSWLKLKFLGMCDQNLVASNWKLLNLFIPGTRFEQEVIWRVGNFL